MEEVTLGISAADMNQLATDLADILGIRLYAQSSPMIGPWYCSQDLSAVFKALRAAGPGSMQKAAAPDADQSYYELVLNDPEPGYTAPEFPDGGNCLLRVRARSMELQRIESRLRDAGLPFKRLKSAAV